MSTSALPQMHIRPSNLTLIVAITPSSGIGRAGTMPWPRIKSEMAYFARVTKRAPREGQKNAVVMGRKTWESIPTKFRPLPGRINVVLSRQDDRLDLGVSEDTKDEVYSASSLGAGLDLLQTKHQSNLGRVFIIGGAQIYAEALKSSEAERVLLTRIKQDYDCDTFFPTKLGDEGSATDGWTKEPNSARDEWIAEEVDGGDEWDVEMWTRK